MRTRTKLFFGLLFVAVLGASVKSAIDSPVTPPDTAKPKAVDPMEAERLVQRLLAQQCVAVTIKNAHDPASLQLPNVGSNDDYPSKFYVGERKKGTLTIQFSMRAKNGFGGVRLYTVDCQFRKTKDEYKFVKYDSWPQK